MLTPKQIDELQRLTTQSITELTDWILNDISRRIAEAGTLTKTAEYQIWRLKNLGLTKRKIQQQISKRVGLSWNTINKLIADSAKDGYTIDMQRLNVTEALPFEENAELLQILTATQALIKGNFDNITQTMGLVNSAGNITPLTRVYEQACDFAQMQVASGVTDYNTAVKNATRKLLTYGVRQIDYVSGVHRNIESAVRGAVMGGIGLMQEQISQHNHDSYGATGWELSAHSQSAPDHEPYQGRQYTDEEYNTLNNSLQRRIGTLNCGHVAYPIIYGVSKPTYTLEQLQEMIDENKKGVTIGGRHYTLYETTQKQRQIERRIRAQKRRIITANAVYSVTGDNTLLEEENAKLKRLYSEYNTFSKQAGQRAQRNRFEMGVQV